MADEPPLDVRDIFDDAWESDQRLAMDVIQYPAVVLKCCVMETNETPWASKVSTSLAKSASERVSRACINQIDPARTNVGK